MLLVTCCAGTLGSRALAAVSPKNPVAVKVLGFLQAVCEAAEALDLGVADPVARLVFGPGFLEAAGGELAGHRFFPFWVRLVFRVSMIGLYAIPGMLQ